MESIIESSGVGITGVGKREFVSDELRSIWEVCVVELGEDVVVTVLEGMVELGFSRTPVPIGVDIAGRIED